MTRYERLFGTGPRGVFLTVGTGVVCWRISERMEPWPIHGQPWFGVTALVVSTVITLVIAAWALRSLPPKDRGKALIMVGAYRHFRHPLYASFLIAFDFGLALYIDHWVMMAWAIAQHPLWHWNIAGEEKLMQREFGENYRIYCRKTGRFVPRFGIKLYDAN
jgi:protein-S-isoprenylcysteine O-methyltransferase Ste14